MFGKKKDKIGQPIKNFHCPVCDLECTDQQTLDRHTSWAHKGLAAGKKSEANKI